MSQTKANYHTMKVQDITVAQETFDTLTTIWKDKKYNLRWEPLFVLPAWLKVWWQSFGSEAELYLRSVWHKDKVIGIAPLMLRGDTASIIGSEDVCDYLDFIATPGKETVFFNALLDDLQQRGVRHLELKSLRPESTVLTGLLPLARQRKYKALCHNNEVSVEVDLPPSWDEYLAMLDKKQRHELRRKLRRLQETDSLEHHCTKVGEQEVDTFMDTFLRLFELTGKAYFMTPRMESFFRSLARAMADTGLLRFGVLDIDEKTVAMVLGFDYNNSIYIYNSAYSPKYAHLSVGLLSKALCLKDGIARGRRKLDLLKGPEKYKYHLGGKEIPLSSCQITLE